MSCNAAGSFEISALIQTLSATARVLCTSPTINDLRLAATPAVLRSNSPYQYLMLADYSDGTTKDVTAHTTWATDPSIAFVYPNGTLSCNNPGVSTLSGTFAGKSIQASYTCILRPITPKPGFVESAATFDGPFASWVNVKTSFGARGDGSHR